MDIYLAPTVDFAVGDDMITKEAKERTYLGSRLSNTLSNPVLIVTSFHIQLFQLTLSD